MENLIFKIPENVEWQAIDKGGIILNLETGVYSRVNEMGAKILSSCDGEKTLEEIAKEIISEFEVEKEVALEDAQSFFENLKSQNLIEVKGG
ncbi:MAG: PqqD family protein [Calditrichaeota bacterium]|nr:MAG: PqqD family protein [Calditrichota bacterium]